MLKKNKPISISDYYQLPYSQGDLRFVDVDVFSDTKVFVDPRAIRISNSPWAKECESILQNFFYNLLDLIKNERHDEAKRLLSGLREPNEAHLGTSTGRALGRGLGDTLAEDVWLSLTKSKSAKTGLIQDLEDTALLIEGIDKDIISDITINIIRRQLIRFTQIVCREYGIPLHKEIDSGPLWDHKNKRWYQELVELPLTEYGKLLLVPKEIVRQKTEYSSYEFKQHYVLTYLQGVELKAGSELVQLLKNGTTRVTKKSVKEKYKLDNKANVIDTTIQNPEILEAYRKAKIENPKLTITHEELLEEGDIGTPHWDDLLKKVLEIETGKLNADKYHKTVKVLLDALFYPELTYPIIEKPLHQRRKRIDISYTNDGHTNKPDSTEFFGWLSHNYPAATIAIECKNYSSDPKNPELDQLAGRFSLSRGQVGILVCRKIEDKALFTKRCKDTAQDGRGFILALDDEDLIKLVDYRKNFEFKKMRTFLQERFDALIF